MASGDDKAVFVDTNILVFATVEEAPLYSRAREAIAQLRAQGSELWISRQVIREYLAVLTRPQTYPVQLTRSEILDAVRSLASQFRMAEDGDRATDQLLRILDLVPVGGREVHDANIVATMNVHNIGRLLTDNSADFARHNESITIMPLRET